MTGNAPTLVAKGVTKATIVVELGADQRIRDAVIVCARVGRGLIGRRARPRFFRRKDS
jgi:hypothetical protein